MNFYGDKIIARKTNPTSLASPSQTHRGLRINEAITSDKIRLIDASGTNKGVISIDEARSLAQQSELDLVEISPDSTPPVCKLLDYGKYKYHIRKKANEARKKQKTFEVKEIKIRPNIDPHDYEVKMRNMKRFFSEGDKVKVTLRFRGREMAHKELGKNLFEKTCADLAGTAKVEMPPKLEGNQMVMVLAPV